MFSEYSVGILPPVYDVDVVGNEIMGILSGRVNEYTQKFRVSNHFGNIVEFIPNRNIENRGNISIVGCLNPDKLTQFSTKDCTMVLFKTPKESDKVKIKDLLNIYKGSVYTLNDYVSLLETSYNTKIALGKEFTENNTRNWLEMLNKKTLMVLRMSSMKLWDYTVDSCDNPMLDATDYMLEFVKKINIKGEEYHASLGWYVTADEEGPYIERLHTLASDSEIEATDGKCLRVNYNRKRFLTELSYLVDVSKEELAMLDTFGNTLIKNIINKPKVVEEPLAKVSAAVISFMPL